MFELKDVDIVKVGIADMNLVKPTHHSIRTSGLGEYLMRWRCHL